jgi:hypothetical protein
MFKRYGYDTPTQTIIFNTFCFSIEYICLCRGCYKRLFRRWTSCSLDFKIKDCITIIIIICEKFLLLLQRSESLLDGVARNCYDCHINSYNHFDFCVQEATDPKRRYAMLFHFRSFSYIFN